MSLGGPCLILAATTTAATAGAGAAAIIGTAPTHMLGQGREIDE
jgi:hypothetical protein